MKMVLTFGLFFVGLWLLIVGTLWMFRDPLVYRFDNVNDVLSPPDAWEAWMLDKEVFKPVSSKEGGPDSVYVWRTNPDASKQVMVTVGNVGRLNDGVFSSRPLVERGYGVTVMAYPGASGAPGKPDQEDIITRAVRLAQGIEKDTGVRPGYYGISMGGAVATIVASRHRPEFLILEAPLGDIWAIARGMYPFLPPVMPDIDTWQSIKVADDVRVPTLVVHGSKDSVVPVVQGRSLATALGARYVELEKGGHNDLARWGMRDHVGKFIEDFESGHIIVEYFEDVLDDEPEFGPVVLE